MLAGAESDNTKYADRDSPHFTLKGTIPQNHGAGKSLNDYLALFLVEFGFLALEARIPVLRRFPGRSDFPWSACRHGRWEAAGAAGRAKRDPAGPATSPAASPPDGLTWGQEAVHLNRTVTPSDDLLPLSLSLRDRE